MAGLLEEFSIIVKCWIPWHEVDVPSLCFEDFQLLIISHAADVSDLHYNKMLRLKKMLIKQMLQMFYNKCYKTN